MGIFDFFKSKPVSEIENILHPSKEQPTVRKTESVPTQVQEQEHCPNCPCCNQKLHLVPKRSGTCKLCKQKYYLISDYETGEQILVNSEGRQKTLLKNETLKRYYEWFNPYFQTTDVNNFDKTTKELIQIKDNWFKKLPNGAYNDFLWSVLRDKLHSSVQNKNFGLTSRLYIYMALILHEEGKDNFNILCEAHKMKLLSLKEHLTSQRKELSFELDMSVTIEESYLNRGSLCENCQKVVGKQMLLEEAIQLKLLPVRDCTCKTGYCDCSYFDLLESY